MRQAPWPTGGTRAPNTAGRLAAMRLPRTTVLKASGLQSLNYARMQTYGAITEAVIDGC
jgi:hypothetical protein